MAFAAALGPLLIILGKTISTVGTTMKTFSSLTKGVAKLGVKIAGSSGSITSLGSALGAVAGPVLAVVAIVAVLVAAFKHLWDTNEEFRNAITGIWEGIKIVPELHVASDHIFIKTKTNALTSEAFCAFIEENSITEFVITGADATACVKSTCYNMTKAGYAVTVLSDCVTSYDKKKIPVMLEYYKSKNCIVMTLDQMVATSLQ